MDGGGGCEARIAEWGQKHLRFTKRGSKDFRLENLDLFSVKSRCKPKTFTAADILCGDSKSSLLNKEEVRKLSSCSLITSYPFTSNESWNHKLMISGQNTMLLTKYDGDMDVEVSQKQRFRSIVAMTSYTQITDED